MVKEPVTITEYVEQLTLAEKRRIIEEFEEFLETDTVPTTLREHLTNVMQVIDVGERPIFWLEQLVTEVYKNLAFEYLQLVDKINNMK